MMVNRANRNSAWLPMALLAVIPLAALDFADAAQRVFTARLDNLSGTVLVDQGERFILGQPGMLLRIGYRVIVLEDSSADIRVRLTTSSLSSRLDSSDEPSVDAECTLQLTENSLVVLFNAEAGCEQPVVRADDGVDAAGYEPATPPASPALRELAPVSCVLFDCLPPELDNGAEGLN